MPQRKKGKKLQSPFHHATQYLTFPVKQHNWDFRSPSPLFSLPVLCVSLCDPSIRIFVSRSIHFAHTPASSPLLHDPVLSLDHLIHWCTRRGWHAETAASEKKRDRDRQKEVEREHQMNQHHIKILVRSIICSATHKKL